MVISKTFWYSSNKNFDFVYNFMVYFCPFMVSQKLLMCSIMTRKMFLLLIVITVATPNVCMDTEIFPCLL